MTTAIEVLTRVLYDFFMFLRTCKTPTIMKSIYVK